MRQDKGTYTDTAEIKISEVMQVVEMILGNEKVKLLRGSGFWMVQ